MSFVELDAPRAVAVRALLTLLALMVGGGLLVAGMRLARSGGAPSKPAASGGAGVSLGLRYLTLMALVVLVIGPAFVGGWVFVASIIALAVLGLREIWSVLDVAGTPALRAPGWICGVGLVPAAALGGPAALAPVLGLGLGLIATWGLAEGTAKLPQRVGGTLLGVIYVGLLCAFMVLVRVGPHGFGRFLFFLVVIQLADLGGLFGGMAFGRHKLVPSLSPGKTWEGLAGSLTLAAAGGALFAFTVPELGPVAPALLGLPLALTGLLGDLLASGFKRSVGFKDFGATLPGHGGILDRFDSYLISAPFAWALFTLLDRLGLHG
jgi:phosphatidate cytidylyltransferase